MLRRKESKLYQMKTALDEIEEGEDEEDEAQKGHNRNLDDELLLGAGAEESAKRKEILRKLKLQVGGTKPPSMTFLPSSEEMQRLIKKATQVKSIKELNF